MEWDWWYEKGRKAKIVGDWCVTTMIRADERFFVLFYRILFSFYLILSFIWYEMSDKTDERWIWDDMEVKARKEREKMNEMAFLFSEIVQIFKNEWE